MSSKLHATLTSKIDAAKLPANTREIFTVLLSFLMDILHDKDKKISEFSERVECLEDEVETLKLKLDESEQYSRRETVVFSGEVPPETTNENTKGKVLKLLEEQADLKLDPSEVSTAHRIGKSFPDGTGTRKIMVKFCRRDVVEEVFSACKSKKPGFYANCSLTPTRGKVFYAVRKLKNLHPNVIKSYSAARGEVAVYVDNGGRGPSLRNRGAQRDKKIVINSKKQLEEFAKNTLKISLDSLDLSW